MRVPGPQGITAPVVSLGLPVKNAEATAGGNLLNLIDQVRDNRVALAVVPGYANFGDHHITIIAGHHIVEVVQAAPVGLAPVEAAGGGVTGCADNIPACAVVAQTIEYPAEQTVVMTI